MSMRIVLCAIVLFGSISTVRADDDAAAPPASVAVTTQAVAQGTLARTVEAYGTASAALDAATTLNIQAAGQVSHFDVAPGTTVKRGEPLLEFALSHEAIVAYAQATSALKLAQAQREHTAQLLSQQLATRDQLAQADKALSDAQATLTALRAQQADRPTAILKAPFDGIVTSIAVAQGDALAAGAALLTVVRSGGVIVMAGVEPAQREGMQPGDAATLIPLAGGAPVSGKVRRIAGAIDPHSRLLVVEVGADASLTPGAEFKLRIVAGSWHGWLVPRDAVIADGDGWRVFQVDTPQKNQGKAVAVPVQIIGETDATTVVSGALVATRPLIVAGSTQVDDGVAVRVAAGAGPAQ